MKLESVSKLTIVFCLAFFFIDNVLSLKMLPVSKQTGSRQSFTTLKVDLNSMKDTQKPIILEIISTKTAAKTQKKSMSYSSSAKKERGEKISEVLDSPVANFFGILINPVTLLFAIYLSSAGSRQLFFGKLGLQKIFNMFGKGELVRKADGTVETAAAAALKDLPFQTFECESCGLEMRPAKGRADVILGRERFRCSRCGAKASAYFNVDDLEDPRAVARLERIKEADNLDEANMDDDDEPDNTSDDDDGDDDE